MVSNPTASRWREGGGQAQRLKKARTSWLVSKSHSHKVKVQCYLHGQQGKTGRKHSAFRKTLFGRRLIKLQEAANNKAWTWCTILFMF